MERRRPPLPFPPSPPGFPGNGVCGPLRGHGRGVYHCCWRCPCSVVSAYSRGRRPLPPPALTGGRSTAASLWHAGGGGQQLIPFLIMSPTRHLKALHLLRCDAPALPSHPLLLLFLRHLALPSIHLSTCLPRRPHQHPSPRPRRETRCCQGYRSPLCTRLPGDRSPWR